MATDGIVTVHCRQPFGGTRLSDSACRGSRLSINQPLGSRFGKIVTGVVTGYSPSGCARVELDGPGTRHGSVLLLQPLPEPAALKSGHMSSISRAVSSVRDLALGIVDSLGSLWMDRGANIRDLNGRDLNDHFALLGNAYREYHANRDLLDAGLHCFARISRQPVATIYASGLSTTEYVLRLCLMFVSSFENIVGVRLQRGEGLTEEEKARLRKAWPVVREPFDNSGVLPTYGQCIELKAEIQWESQRAMDTEASKPVEGAHTAARPPSPDPLPSRPTSVEASIATQANISRESESMSDQNPDMLPDYPHQFPLVGERGIVKAKQAAERRNLDLQQTALVNLGFPWDFWLPIELARKWRSSVFPRIATREAVHQWKQFVQEQIGWATIAQSNRPDSPWPVVGNKVAEALESDLKLIERHACHLVAVVMSDPMSAVRQAVRALIDAEWDNFRAGIHRAGSKHAEVLRQRDERLTELRRLMAKALPVGIKAGFTGETVEGRLNELALAAQALTEWDRTMERRDPGGVAYLDETSFEWQQTDSLDDQAEAHLVQLCESVEPKLNAVENLAAAAAQTLPESAQDPVLPQLNLEEATVRVSIT